MVSKVRHIIRSVIDRPHSKRDLVDKLFGAKKVILTGETEAPTTWNQMYEVLEAYHEHSQSIEFISTMINPELTLRQNEQQTL